MNLHQKFILVCHTIGKKAHYYAYKNIVVWIILVITSTTIHAAQTPTKEQLLKDLRIAESECSKKWKEVGNTAAVKEAILMENNPEKRDEARRKLSKDEKYKSYLEAQTKVDNLITELREKHGYKICKKKW